MDAPPVPDAALHGLLPAPPAATDWAEVAERLRGDPAGSRREYYWLVMRGPDDLARELLRDERYFDAWSGAESEAALLRIAARRGLAALALLLHAAERHGLVTALAPFRDAAVARVMVGALDGDSARADQARVWFMCHGRDAAVFVVPDALRDPGPERDRAGRALALIARVHGVRCVVAAAREYGAEAAAAVEALGLDPLLQCPDPPPEPDEAFVRERLPRVLLRGRAAALPVPAVRALVTMLRMSTVEEPYGGCEQVLPRLDRASLADLAWALYEHRDRADGRWAAPDVRYALQRLGDGRTAARLAREMGGWDGAAVPPGAGHEAVEVLAVMAPDDAPAHLDRLARTAAAAELRAAARDRLGTAARVRGLTPEQLADRLVPRLGPDAPADDVRAVLAEQAGRLEEAMLSGRSWAVDEFREVLVAHPLLGRLARRLVWSASPPGPDGSAAFRVLDDGAFADVRGVPFVPPEGARITLPHPVRLDGAEAWADVFAGHAVSQPFAQLARPAHVLTDGERASVSLGRLRGTRVPTGRIVALTARGWSLPAPPLRMVRQRQLHRTTPDGHALMVTFEPGIHVRHPHRYAEQELHAVLLVGARQARWGDVDPVAVSELLTALTTDPTPPAVQNPKAET
ncbi:DUF4132 domain-containing protein [Actinomadura sp. WAC 06369]|uniref:DUF4132 domain-containing protein n=1 Tax=Actinomadura sp. WAC 06369 TaxID=2203193 RepID=UPI000F7A11EE|nr:DUF4132 domain-containing protein [Actinomadura sp. WAC 06369]RSN71540.1 hypothetical protein DMH08_01920 [Actinomadura sp. WAC 06369]